MQLTGGKKPAVGILYDSDFGARIDSILALAMLHGMETKQEARLASITISNSDLESARLCDVIEKFYLNPNPIIGLAEAGEQKRELCRTVLDRLQGKPAIRKLTDTARPEVLMRNALSAQYDANAAIVCCGPPVNLQRLLSLAGAAELIRAKVRSLVVTGAAPEGWPTPVTVAREAVGRAIPFPGALMDDAFSYAPEHPIAAAYRAYGTMPYDAPTTALAAVLYAIMPSRMTEPLNKAWMVEAYMTFTAMKPQPRFRRPAVVDDNKVAQ